MNVSVENSITYHNSKEDFYTFIDKKILTEHFEEFLIQFLKTFTFVITPRSKQIHHEKIEQCGIYICQIRVLVVKMLFACFAWLRQTKKRLYLFAFFIETIYRIKEREERKVNKGGIIVLKKSKQSIFKSLRCVVSRTLRVTRG